MAHNSTAWSTYPLKCFFVQYLTQLFFPYRLPPPSPLADSPSLQRLCSCILIQGLHRMKGTAHKGVSFTGPKGPAELAPAQITLASQKHTQVFNCEVKYIYSIFSNFSIAPTAGHTYIPTSHIKNHIRLHLRRDKKGTTSIYSL